MRRAPAREPRPRVRARAPQREVVTSVLTNKCRAVWRGYPRRLRLHLASMLLSALDDSYC